MIPDAESEIKCEHPVRRWRIARIDWDRMPLLEMQNHDPGDEDRSER